MTVKIFCLLTLRMTPNDVKRTLGELSLRMERKKPLSDPWRHTIPSWHPSSSSARLSTERNIIQHKYEYIHNYTYTDTYR